MADQINELVEQRVALETRLQNEKGELSEAGARSYDEAYSALQRKLATRFKALDDERDRITVMLELMRILENRLVYLHNFIVDPTADNRVLAPLGTQFIDDLAGRQTTVLTRLAATYHRP